MNYVYARNAETGESVKHGLPDDMYNWSIDYVRENPYRKLILSDPDMYGDYLHVWCEEDFEHGTRVRMEYL